MTTISDIEFIIPCGGKSTRNFPHSKGVAHKCLLPLGDTRLIDVVLQDIVKIGGKHITIVCSNEETIATFKEALLTDTATEEKLRNRGKSEIADALASTFLPPDVEIQYVIQREPLGTAHVLGLAHRVSHARHAALIFPDDIIFPKNPLDSHLKYMVESFLKDEHQILLTGIEKEDVSNNSIIHENRLIEKPKIAYNHIGGFSPFIFPKELLDFIEAQVDTFEHTGQKPENLPTSEWVYTDGINQFLDSEPNGKWLLKMQMKRPQDDFMDTGNLPLYELAQLKALLQTSRFKKANRELAKHLLGDG